MVEKKMMDYHGDDYGISMNNAGRMLELIKAGKLDSISIIPNMTTTDEALRLLVKEWPNLEHKPLISVHVNIVDGFSLTDISDGLFTHEVKEVSFGHRYVFHTSWFKLFMKTILPGAGRDRVKALLIKEIEAQLDNVYPKLPEGCSLRIDAHVHTQMIPVVFDSVMEAVDALDYRDKLEFVRISREPILPFVRIFGTIPPVSLVKNLLLNILSGRNERILDKRGVEYGLLWGLMMTGRMDAKRVGSLLPAMKNYAEKKGKTMEVLFHPGIVDREEKYEEYGPDDMEHFYSDNRDVEYDAVMNIVR